MKSDYAKEIELISGPLEAAMDALASTLSANQEVVLHNLTRPGVLGCQNHQRPR
ncbi:Uncharacterised protein [Enterobacter cancerogenus]|uniref:Uncharacterized protein n=1 Tax=Enterobacter cancerogenus TaxID=69218 RepID=A0A484Z496_9ENTR|nr:Uncharacterised protein [Enterobacter cancerogenus]